MNVGSMQVLLGGKTQSSARSEVLGAAAGVGKKTFESVLSNMTENPETCEVNLENRDSDVAINDAIPAIFNATTVEELIEGLKLGGISIPEFQNLQELGQLNRFEEVDISNLVELFLPLLEQAGLSESEMLAASTANDLGAFLTLVDEVGPKLFSEMVSALEGKSVLPKEQAIELLVILKTVALKAPETDLTMKQEQQLFSLQGLLVTAGERVENTLKISQSRNNVLHLMDAKQVHHFTNPSETNQENMKDAPKETVQQPSVNVLATMKTEVEPADLENRNHARNETLLREMQTIFKRSNFGQAGGANRLLIKLYPEHLGQVRIELIQTNGIMTARILASSAQGKEMLDSQLHQLRSAFLQQNLQVERIDISQTLEDTSKNDDQHGMFNQHFKNEQDDLKEPEEKNEEEEISFQEYMIELEA